MKTLLIVRHAKSSWDDPAQSDFVRPLNDRGKRDAPRMAKRLKEKELYPNFITTSPSIRTLETAKAMAKGLQFPQDKIQTDKRLYHADEDTIMTVLQDHDDELQIVMLFAHNPGITDFVNSFKNDEIYIDNVPTCGVVAFTIAVNSWKDLNWGMGKLLFFDYPKSKDD
jgi:phosphohistidine phosphatase